MSRLQKQLEDMAAIGTAGGIETFSIKDLIQLAQYHKDGNSLTDLPVMCEMNARTKPIPGVIVYWEIGEAKLDITGWGKYVASVAHVRGEDGKLKTWPFSMLYVKPN